MSTRARGALRGAAFAVFATLLAAVAHTLGGAGAPSPLFCAVIAVLATPLAMLLAGPRVRAWRTAGSVTASQTVFHVAFTVVGDLGAWEPGALGHAHEAAALELAAASAHVPSTGMLAAHAAAAAITTWLIRVGERGVVAIHGWTMRLMTRAPFVLPAERRVPVLLPLLLPTAASARVAAHPLSRRGPPRSLRAA